MIEHKYVVLQSSWGISIKIVGSLDKYDEKYKEKYKENNFCQINESFFLCCSNEYSTYPNLLGQEEKELIKNVIIFLNKNKMLRSQYEKTIIIINGIQYNYCDYQKDGLIVAIIEWMAEAFGFSSPKIPVMYDANQNKYIFDFSVLYS